MTSRRTREILTLGVEHEFSGGGYRDVDFVVPDATLRQLRRGRMIARAGEGSLTVACEGGDAVPVMPLDGISLAFGVRAHTASFGAVTAFPFDLPATVALYTNAADRRALGDPTPVTLTGPELRHVLGGAARPVKLTVTDEQGHVVATRTVPAGALDPSLSLDLRGRELGRYMVEEMVGGGPGQRRSYYVQPELQRHGLLAVVEVALRSDFYGAPAVLRLSFRAKEQPLRYYVIASNYSAAEFDQLNIADLGFTDDLRPEIRFTRVAAGAFAADELAPALLGAPDARVALFRSQAALPRRLAPRRRLQLSRNGTVLAEHLPQPRADAATADVLVHLAKP